MGGITDPIRLHAQLRPQHPAIVEPDRTIDHAGLDRRVNGFAARAAAAGIRRGDRVGLALGDNGDHLVAMLGLARLGAVMLPMDRRWADDEAAGVARAFGASAVLVEPGRQTGPAAWIRPGPDWFAETDTVVDDPEVGPDSPLLLTLSSGTTGRPKGPLITHRQFEARFMAYWLNLGFDASDVFVSATPLYFGGGRGFAWANLFSGATVVLCPQPFDASDLVDCVRRHSGTTMFLVPTLLRRLLALPGDAAGLPGMRCLVSSGSALFAQEKAEIRQRITPNLYEMYSSSEGGAVSVLTPAEAGRRPDSVGRAVFRVEVQTVDADHRPVPRGEIGTMRYRGPGVPDSPAATDGSGGNFRDGWLYPGDLAVIGEDGLIRLCGRVKDMIIRGGVNIYPADIEAVLLESGALVEAAVIGVPHPDLGEVAAAFVVLRPGAQQQDLAAWCRTRLAPYKVPARIIAIDALPRNAGGKVVKATLLERATEGMAGGPGPDR